MLHVIAPISKVFLTCKNNKHTQKLDSELYKSWAIIEAQVRVLNRASYNSDKIS
jgi:hypothetical protein